MSARKREQLMRRNLNACIEHLDLLERAMDGSALYTCQLCGARPEDDHTDDCELMASSRRLKALALEAK